MQIEHLSVFVGLDEIIDTWNRTEDIGPLWPHLNHQLEPSGFYIGKKLRIDRGEEQRTGAINLSSLHGKIHFLRSGISGDHLDIGVQEIFQKHRVKLAGRSATGRTENRF